MFYLNLVSFDVPYPPDYGGVADIFYKIVALHDLGVGIYLHCFDYGRGERTELHQYCEKIYYYKRRTGLVSNVSFLPYIVESRRDGQLLENLKSNSFPILLEGIHSSYYLLRGELCDRVVLLRSHNIEHDYYRYLAGRESNPIRRLFFRKEAYLLKKALRRLPADITIGAISPADTEYLDNRFSGTFWLPPFHSNHTVTSLEGRGEYALYHGNLSVSENTEVVSELIESFSGKDIPLIIAGKGPSAHLSTRIRAAGNVLLVADPTTQQMEKLVKQAHVILLPTRQPTGIKLKLIESLYRGRFCVANRAMVRNTRLEGLVVIEEVDFYAATRRLMGRVFSAADISNRREVVNTHYDNRKNAALLVKKINFKH